MPWPQLEGKELWSHSGCVKWVFDAPVLYSSCPELVISSSYTPTARPDLERPKKTPAATLVGWEHAEKCVHSRTEGPHDIEHSTPPPPVPSSLRRCCSGRVPRRGLRAYSGHQDAAKHCGTRQWPLHPLPPARASSQWGRQRPGSPLFSPTLPPPRFPGSG